MIGLTPRVATMYRTQRNAMMDVMIRQARDIARGLRPPLLDEAGLADAGQCVVVG